MYIMGQDPVGVAGWAMFGFQRAHTASVFDEPMTADAAANMLYQTMLLIPYYK
jgi:hypothetical protein